MRQPPLNSSVSPHVKRITFFGGGVLLVFLVAAAVSVYGFDAYERAWGRGGSFQVETWIALVGALIAMGAFGISSATLQRIQTHGAAFALGAVSASIYLAVCWALNFVAPGGGAYIALLLLVVISVLASFAGARIGG